MQRTISFSEGEYYHIYNRGVEKRDIFMERRDYDRFIKLLYATNSTKPVVYREIENKLFSEIDREQQLVAIGAYCLMPNHFHLLVKEMSEGGISKFMEKLGTGYSMYFNKKYKRSGFLFQGNFKAEHVDSDEYLKYLYSYIHLNPVKLIDPEWKKFGIRDAASAKKFLEGYRDSSYLDYLSREREEKLILSKNEFPRYFDTPKDFGAYVHDWLEYVKTGETLDYDKPKQAQ